MCINYVMKNEGLNGKQAAGKCYGMWKEHVKKKHSKSDLNTALANAVLEQIKMLSDNYSADDDNKDAGTKEEKTYKNDYEGKEKDYFLFQGKKAIKRPKKAKEDLTLDTNPESVKRDTQL